MANKTYTLKSNNAPKLATDIEKLIMKSKEIDEKEKEELIDFIQIVLEVWIA
jgi:hypothetical protein